MIDIDRVKEDLIKSVESGDDYYSPFVNAFEKWIICYAATNCMMSKGQLVKEIKRKFMNNAAVNHQYFMWLARQQRDAGKVEQAEYCEVMAAVYQSFAEGSGSRTACA